MPNFAATVFANQVRGIDERTQAIDTYLAPVIIVAGCYEEALVKCETLKENIKARKGDAMEEWVWGIWVSSHPNPYVTNPNEFEEYCEPPRVVNGR